MPLYQTKRFIGIPGPRGPRGEVAGTAVVGEVPSGTIDDSNTVFTLTHTPDSGTLKIYLNGARQKITEDYILSGGTITFISAPSSGSILIVDYNYL